MIDTLGLNANITVTTPLKQQLRSVELITVFFNSITLCIVLFLALLCTQLIYSLMLSDVDEKTFEFGMLRALGFNTKNLTVMIIMQAFTFSIPGLITGIILSSLVNVLVRDILYQLCNNYYTYWLSIGAIWFGCAIGIVIPVFSNIIPIQNALGKNLRASLDLYHRSVSDISVSVQKLQDYGLSIPQLIMSLMLVILGIFTYYVAPSAFLYRNYELFFLILNCVLLLMILGLTFISILLLPVLQNIMLGIMLLINRVCCPCWKDRKIKVIIQKNMESHQIRNTKTAIMFAISLSFLIFAGSTFTLIGKLIKSTLEQSVGTDLLAASLDYRGLNVFIDEGPIKEFLEQQRDLDGAVVDFTFTTFNLEAVFGKINPGHKTGTKISDFGGYKQYNVRINGIEENYL